MTFAFLVLVGFSTVPSPLYGLYAHRDGFSSFVITLIYGAYTLGVAASLFFTGHLSDLHGRRPLLLAALAAAATSAVVFLSWPELPGLFVARVLTGLSVGVTASTATAYLTELHAAHRPTAPVRRAQLTASAANVGGLGFGALAAGLLAQHAGHALTVPYLVFLALIIIATAAILLAPETRFRPDPLPAYRPQRMAVPHHSRAQFAAALLGVVVAFAVLGMFVGLAGTFLSATLHHTSLALAGGTVFLVFAVGVVVLAGTNTWPIRRLLVLGVALMLAGLALVVVAAWLPAPSLVVFLTGGAVIGGGGCAVFKTALTIVVGVGVLVATPTLLRYGKTPGPEW
ncbi:MFS family permease [Amycolatopsis bartoniae]|uniref:MFS transporter n=1 Tax=Amycolatopsis bartoniae TaxID=941986 RepID=UPI0016061D3A|nr:MFS transporter [Amycolatopsis bartoniae]MBB2938567.1 MFS family permease [Amycolatopsis bartoniae]